MFKNDIINFFKRTVRHKITTFDEYTDLFTNMNREIYISTITPQVAENIDKKIRMWNTIDDAEMVEWSKRTPIKLYINSVGGDFNSMQTIMDIIKISKTPVYTINTGIVYKEAFFIFITGHQRYAYPTSSFMYERDLKHLDEEDRSLDNYIAFYERQLAEIKEVVLEKTKITENEYNKHLKGTWWMTAEDAQKLRICNEVLHAYQSIH
jgi:ATP-dependent Clp protease protease subunit